MNSLEVSVKVVNGDTVEGTNHITTINNQNNCVNWHHPFNLTTPSTMGVQDLPVIITLIFRRVSVRRGGHLAVVKMGAAITIGAVARVLHFETKIKCSTNSTIDRKIRFNELILLCDRYIRFNELIKIVRVA